MHSSFVHVYAWVCVLLRWMYASSGGAKFLYVLFFYHYVVVVLFFFYLTLLRILKTNSYEEGCMCESERERAMCAWTPPTVLQQCVSPSGVTPRHYILRTRAFSKRLHVEQKKKRRRIEHKVIDICQQQRSRDREICLWYLWDLYVFTWFCLFLQSCESATEQ